ncbi:MAG: PD-(D/E)XK nuclease family transposase, partial [Deltaproteobacteria bacterium]|nr:PD-(D/E)XK nuclease family transposase [Deltaproteobacteria bacterium]
TDGARVDVEMECDAQRGHGARWLYHWARLFGGTLRRGDEYADLKPVVCIVFLAAKTERFHARYSVREERDGSLLSHVLGIHVIGLPAVERAASEHEPAELTRWARFLRLDAASALDSLATESPIMAEAKHALELLSLEPSAQRIAEMRREAGLLRRLDRAEQRAEGREEGRAEGDAAARRERADALRGSIVRASAVFGLTLDDARRAQLESSDDQQLQTLLDALLATGGWPNDG